MQISQIQSGSDKKGVQELNSKIVEYNTLLKDNEDKLREKDFQFKLLQDDFQKLKDSYKDLQ